MLLSSYTRALKRHDRDLFAGLTKDGMPCVFRRVKRFVPIYVDEGFKFLDLIEDKQLIMALTDNWTMRGRPRAWGIDFVLDRIKEIDTQANERLFEEIDRKNETVDESHRRQFRNEAEAFWSDNRRAFVKATDDILIHSLSKDEPKKRLKDRSIRNGNYQSDT